MNRNFQIYASYLLATVFLCACHQASSGDARKGFCAKENRYLTDAEITDAAVDGLIAHFKIKDEYTLKTDGFEFNKEFKFKTRQEFYQKNPFCCYRIVDPKHEKHVGLGQHDIEIYGEHVYRMRVKFTTSNGEFYIVPAVSTCGEFKSGRYRVRKDSKQAVEPHSEILPDRSKR